MATSNDHPAANPSPPLSDEDYKRAASDMPEKLPDPSAAQDQLPRLCAYCAMKFHGKAVEGVTDNCDCKCHTPRAARQEVSK